MTIKVLIADDQALVRGAFSVLVNSVRDLVVVGQAANGLEAVRLAQGASSRRGAHGHPHAGHRRIEATRTILGGPDGEGPRILILTTFDVDEYIYEALRPGAGGSSSKDTPAGTMSTPSGSLLPARRCWHRA